MKLPPENGAYHQQARGWMADPPRRVRMADVCGVLGVTRFAVMKWIKAGKVKATKEQVTGTGLSPAYVIDFDSLRDFVFGSKKWGPRFAAEFAARGWQ